MGSDAKRGWSFGPDSEPERLNELLREHFARFGRDVCDLLASSAKQSDGLREVLEKLGIVSEDDTLLQIGRLISWIDTNGTRALFRKLAPEASNYVLKPVGSSGDMRQHDQRLLELVVKTRKPSAAAPATPPYPAPSTPCPSAPAPGEASTSSAPPAAPRYPSPPATPPPEACKPVAPVPAAAPKPPQQAAAPSASNIPADGPFTGPPGYPYPWPPHLRPGPVAPPHNVPPEQLSWPHIERRSGKDRREGKDRRGTIDVVYKNRRFGGERRKGDRRKGGGGKPTS